MQPAPGIKQFSDSLKRFQRITMQVNPYLLFNGQCEAAFKFYEKCLSGKIDAMLTHASMPAEQQVASEWKDKILHARMTVGQEALMGSDVPPDRYERPAGFSVSIQVKEPEEAERIFHALAENGTVHLPIGPTFWSVRFGMLVDRFGIPWMINCEQAA
jgi:PhnB protein